MGGTDDGVADEAMLGQEATNERTVVLAEVLVVGLLAHTRLTVSANGPAEERLRLGVDSHVVDVQKLCGKVVFERNLKLNKETRRRRNLDGLFEPGNASRAIMQQISGSWARHATTCMTQDLFMASTETRNLQPGVQ